MSIAEMTSANFISTRRRKVVAGAASVFFAGTLIFVGTASADDNVDRTSAQSVKSSLVAIQTAYSAGDQEAMDSAIDDLKTKLNAALDARTAKDDSTSRGSEGTATTVESTTSTTVADSTRSSDDAADTSGDSADANSDEDAVSDEDATADDDDATEAGSDAETDPDASPDSSELNDSGDES